MTQDTTPSDLLIGLTSDIVAAHVSNNPVAVNQVPGLIQIIYNALAGLGQAAEPEVVIPVPAVSIRSSVKPESITCLECGKKMTMLKRHLATDHVLSVDDYRTRWNLNADYPLVAPNYAEKRRQLAKSIGLGRKPGQKRGRRKAQTAA
jgi:predicted transcriptional regulator